MKRMRFETSCSIPKEVRLLSWDEDYETDNAEDDRDYFEEDDENEDSEWN